MTKQMANVKKSLADEPINNSTFKNQPIQQFLQHPDV